ncbi:MAG TPA: protein kinase [Acidobacteriota bacterium]|nr:protein kinase [Acidobacteriota bacterium]HNT99086.1 protein kinase [Acidobacteriota bacterium]HPB27453.1 protein kinase [Acidobacteriota bacterium]HQO24728.1 protein kinase [Acidobacteriota bacterium]HQP73208.1 protein kinase [Acidobacteriota bacterium]
MTSDSRHRHADGPAANPDEGPETVVLPGRSGATPPHRHAEDPLPPPALPAASGTGRAAAPPEAPTEETGWPAPGWALYRCERLLGVGGMGRVYLAWDNRLNRRVAVKFLSGDDPECVQRFFREARAQARIDHPHVGKVYEVGEVHGRPYIAMQFIEGRALSAAAAGMSLEQKVLIIRQAAEAVHAAHRMGLIHRDIKPANIMVETNEDGTLTPFVVDFGLVREMGGEALTVSGTSLGTPAFVSPEQALGQAGTVDRRADVYSLGATLYALLAGHPPFEAATPVEALLQAINKEPDSLRLHAPAVPVDLECVVMKCLEKDPRRRYDSARALADELDRFLNGEPIQARPPGLVERIGKRLRKHKAVAAVAGVALVATAVLLALWWQARRDAAEQAELAQRFGQRVEQVEGVLWRAQSLDIHDIRPAKAMVRRAMQAIEREMRARGGVAAGPGYSALGRGYLALHDFDRAREHLERAWNMDYRTPEVAFALGSTLGQIYFREEQALYQIQGKKQREARRDEIVRTLREPACRYLRAGAGLNTDCPEWPEAILAFYEGRLRDALTKAGEAFRRLPWLYEAKVLEGRIWRGDGAGHRIAGRYSEAMAAYRRAAKAYEAAIRVAPSDAQVRLDLANLWADVLFMGVWYTGQPDADAFPRTLAAAGEAQRIDPDLLDAYKVIIDTRSSWMEHLFNTGQPADAEAAEVVRVAEEALRRQPDSVAFLDKVATVYWQCGKLAMTRQEDPQPLFLKGIASMDRLLAVEPDNVVALNTHGLIQMDLGVYRESLGEDPTANFEAAAASLERALAVGRENVSSGVNLALALLSLMEYQIPLGQGDPPALARRAEAALAAAEKANPNTHWTHRTRAGVRLATARWRATRGEPMAEEVAAARAALARAGAINPNDEMIGLYLADCELCTLYDAMVGGRDWRPALRAARRQAAALAAGPLAAHGRHLSFKLDRLERIGRAGGRPDPRAIM